jgi:hypothetical protein
MHVHIALFRWKDSARPQEIETALAMIESLQKKVPGIVEIICRKNESKYSEGYTHAVMVRGESQAAIDAYRAHPDHLIAARQIEAMEEKGIGVDFEV